VVISATRGSGESQAARLASIDKHGRGGFGVNIRSYPVICCVSAVATWRGYGLAVFSQVGCGFQACPAEHRWPSAWTAAVSPRRDSRRVFPGQLAM